MTVTPHNRIAPPKAAQEVSDGVFAWIQHDGSWWINNCGFVVGDGEVISVDSCSTEARTRAYLKGIARVAPVPVRTLINTHHHGDHMFGNYLFEDATIIGQENLRPALQAWGPPQAHPIWTDVDWGDIRLRPPTVTFRDGIDLWSGDLRYEVRHHGRRAHTNNDSVVWIPERKVLFAGDLIFNGGTPFLVQGSVIGALATLAEVKQLAPDVIVPGHGPVCGPEAIDSVVAYLEFLLDVATRAREAGLAPLAAARETDLGEFAGLTDPERLVGNLHRAYADLEGSLHVDPRAALEDMITFNGGAPLTCHA